jgi:nucleotide-binding universal stress UspA family protein
MYRRILVPLDGSPLAESALPFAVSLAERSRGEIHLAQAVAALRPFGMFEETDPEWPEWMESARTRSANYLAEVGHRLESAGATSPIHTHLLSGPPVRAIQEFVLREEIDQVVMTTHGRGRFQRMWLGSVADGVLRSVPSPVFLWRGPGEDPVRLESRPALQCLLVALDGSEMAEAILPWAEELARLFDARIALVGVAADGEEFAAGETHRATGDPGAQAATMLRLQSYMERTAKELGGRGLDVEYEVLSGVQPHEGILSEQGRTGADIVVLSTRGRDPRTRLLLGSVADKVIRGSEGHVLLHRDAGE